MHLKNKEETIEKIDEWRSSSLSTQAVNLRKAIDNLELDQMYYDQKGSERGTERCDACLKLLRVRLAEISEK